MRKGCCLIAMIVVIGTMPLVRGAESSDVLARKALLSIVPKARIDAVEESPLPGFRQALVGDQLIYVSDDGRFLLQGTLYDTTSKRDLTGARLAIEQKSKVDAVPKSKRIVFAPGKPKYKVTVFTDLDCGYCRKLHSQIAEYLRRGIEVDYLFFPRTGIGSPSYDKAVSVWCAKDRKAAFTAAKAGHDPVSAKCPNPVAEEFRLGVAVGVRGTPTILAADGTKIGGYLTPDQMLSKLQKLGDVAVAQNN
ncbi:MAG: DsbC family protein [Rhodanobacteraceae bacterium]